VHQREREGLPQEQTQRLRKAALAVAACGIVAELDPAVRDFVLSNEVHVPDRFVRSVLQRWYDDLQTRWWMTVELVLRELGPPPEQRLS
jgi:hypothetical protein